MYEIYVRQAIEAGLADSEAGRTLDVKEIRANSGWHRESTTSQPSNISWPSLHIA